jgi:hypothetical protein
MSPIVTQPVSPVSTPVTLSESDACCHKCPPAGGVAAGANTYGLTLRQVADNPALRALFKLAIRAEEQGDRCALNIAVDAIRAEQLRMGLPQVCPQ